jgi:DNA-nicking Smr family endonuclease
MEQLHCRYFKAGTCTKGTHCEFKHTLEPSTSENLTAAPVCRFFAAGRCLKGELCPFEHRYENENEKEEEIEEKEEEEELLSSQLDSTQTQNEIDDLVPREHRRNAPELADNVDSMRSNFASLHLMPNGELTLAARLRFNELQQIFGDVMSPYEIEHVYVEQAGCSFDVAKRLLAERFPQTAASAASSSSAATMPDKSGVASAERERVLGAAMRAEKTRRAVRADGSVPWVETGSMLDKQYTALRQEAIDHANTRNSLYERSTKAYLNFDKASATELSRLAREHDKKMRAINTRAAQYIFETRNARLANNHIDLHGLHVREAIGYLSRFLGTVPPSTEFVYVITGTGTHTTNRSRGKPRLQAAIADHLLSLNFHFDAPASSDPRGGTFRVHFQSFAQ